MTSRLKKMLDSNMKKVLVLVADYPDNNGNVSLMYVHTRNLFYMENNIDVTVLNFKANYDYLYEGVKVISLNRFASQKNVYENWLLILHAANLRNHFRFLKKYGNMFPNKIFFFHGHEVLKISEAYSKPYYFVRRSPIRVWLQNTYDDIKLLLWKNYFENNYEQIHFVFVSNWMHDNFLKFVKCDSKILEGRHSITYNSIGEDFKNGTYETSNHKEYDFVTIRGVLDGSKYAIDIVNKLAQNSPQMRFLLVGKGNFFNHYKKAENITWIDSYLSHGEIIKVLQKAKFALMPTRTDAQGLMMCEMAAFGIPVITSDIPVCHEVFDGFENAYLINNEETNDLTDFSHIESRCIKDDRFFLEKTAINEVRLIKMY